MSTNIIFTETPIVVLGGIDLPDLVIDGDFGFNKIAASVERTIQGKAIVTEQVVQGSAFDLIGGDNWGWIDRTTMLSLVALAEAINTTYNLNYNGTIYLVRFRHEDGMPIEASPLLARPNADDDDSVVSPEDYWYNNVRVRLMKL
jgi:hypothetical protein